MIAAAGFVRPVVVISRCIDFDSCRYNGGIVKASLREELEPHIDLRPICPELEIGLGVPRDPVRLVRIEGSVRMLQPATERDLTEKMNSWSQGWLGEVGAVDGFILKAKSPSCGIRNVKVFQGLEPDRAPAPGSGLFAAHVQEMFPGAAVEDEGRLNNLRIREHFLTKLFALSGFGRAVAEASMRALVDYQARNKLLLMAYNQTRMRAMGRIVANQDELPREELVRRYRDELATALARPPRPASNINVLMHALGYFSDQLSAVEKAQFLDTLESYRAGRAPLSAPQTVIGSWIARFDVPYLQQQSYFAPYPPELVRLVPIRRRSERDVFDRA